jgi:hypothetical protein
MSRGHKPHFPVFARSANTQKFLTYAGKGQQGLQLNDIRCLGWQILTSLQFLHEKGLTHGMNKRVIVYIAYIFSNRGLSWFAQTDCY